jgi:acyl carrier protein
MLDKVKAVREIIAFHFGLAETEITEDATFADLGADSLDLYEVAMSLEEKFNIIVPDYVVEKLLTVGDAIAFVTEAGRATRPFFSTRSHFGIGSKVERA